MRYVLRPPVAQERVDLRPDGLVRNTLKKAYADGTVAADMDPPSLLCRLATSVPPPRFHTVRYAGVLAPASTLEIAHRAQAAAGGDLRAKDAQAAGGYRPGQSFSRARFGVDVLACPKCQERMRLLAMVTDAAQVARCLAAMGQATEVVFTSPRRRPWTGSGRSRSTLPSATALVRHHPEVPRHGLGRSQRERSRPSGPASRSAISRWPSGDGCRSR